MITAARRVKSLLPLWNEQILTEDDFYQCCTEQGILLLEVAMKWKGIYLVRRSVPVILIASNLTPSYRQRVHWHELGHHFLHSPDSNFFDCHGMLVAEREAFMASACALIPRDLVESMTAEEVVDFYHYHTDLVRYRYYLTRNFNI